MEFRFKHIVNYVKKDKLTLSLFVFFIVLIVVALLSSCGSNTTAQVDTPITTTQVTIPVTTTQVTVPPTTTTTLPDLSGVDFVELARSAYGVCGEYHDLAIKVGWPEEEWPRLQQVMWRESRCTTEAWNGADAGLTQINQIHSQWLSDMGWSHPNDMFNPEYNLTFALRLWETSGWKPWRFSGSTFGD